MYYGGDTMLKIAVLNATNQGKQLMNHLLLYSFQKNTELEVSAFSTSVELCKANTERFYDLIFLNIDVAEEDIQQIWVCFRDEMRNEETAIIFISENKQCPAEYIKLHPRDYLVQPVTYKNLSKCMDSYMRFKFQGNVLFSYKKNRTVCTINVSRIVYLQSIEKKVVIHTKKEKIEFYGKLSECMKADCFNHFICIHQSFFINSQYIERVEREYVILTGDVRLPISRAKAENIRKWSCEKLRVANFSI